MARQRFIHPDIWADPSLGELTTTERLFFIGCFSNADDDGRILGNPAFLRATIFPYDDLRVEDIRQIRDRVITACKNILLYQVNGQDYMAFLKWRQYQKPKYPKPSKLPAPPLQEDGETFPLNRGNDGEELEKPSAPRSRLGLDLDRDGMGRDGMGRDVEPTTAAPDILLVKIFEKEFGRLLSPMETEKVLEMAGESTPGVVTEALRRAMALGKRNIRYIDGIVTNWQGQGLKTLAEVLAYEEAFDAKKNTKGTGPPQNVAKAVQQDKTRLDEQVKAAVFGIDYELKKLADKSPDNIRAVLNMPKLNYDPEVKTEALKRLNLSAYAGGG